MSRCFYILLSISNILFETSGVFGGCGIVLNCCVGMASLSAFSITDCSDEIFSSMDSIVSIWVGWLWFSNICLYLFQFALLNFLGCGASIWMGFVEMVAFSWWYRYYIIIIWYDIIC